MSAGWVAAAIMVSPGVGTGVAHAQECDPVETAKLLADDGAVSDLFGYSVAMSSDTAIIGASADDDNGSASGSAYVFTQIGGVWSQQTKLLPDDGAEDDLFGHSVSISGDAVVIGARFDDDNGTDSGSAYVFIRSGGMWIQQAKLLSGDGSEADLFGYSVSLSGDTVVIGATGDDENGDWSGSAYVFTRSGGMWTQQAKLLPEGGTAGDTFGRSIFINGDTTVIGAYGNGGSGASSGSAYVFTRIGGVWSQQTKLLPDDGAEDDLFGHSVSISGDTVVIGALRDDDDGNNSGSAYIFTRIGGVWSQQAKLLPNDGAEGDQFGHSVSISGDTVVIGARFDDDNGINSGSAYVFTRYGGEWIERAKLVAVDGARYDLFGYSISISGDTAITGAHLDNDDDNGINSGSAYIFDLNCNTCPADLDGDGIVDTRDFIAFLGAWSAGELLADWDENGLIDTRDFIAYLADWAAGCP